jgi:calcineurin-like phosphoesterase family protein
MEEYLIDQWNAVVGKDDHVYVLGDFALTWGIVEDAVKIDKILAALNGQKHLIVGNHDHKLVRRNKRWNEVKDYKCLSVDLGGPKKQQICLSHYAFRTWQGMYKGSWMLHGHCIDKSSEILTDSGWKKYSEIIAGQSLPTFNRSSGCLETDVVKNVFLYPNYSGQVFEFRGKSVDTRVTSGHKMIRFNTLENAIEEKAKDFFSRDRCVVARSGNRSFEGLNISDDLIRLYVVMSADGSIKDKTGLCRVRVFKDRKKEYVKSLLNSLGISFKSKSQKDGSVSYNFYIPDRLRGWNIKGSEPRLNQMTCEQFEVLLDAYANTDGNLNGSGVCVYTAKKEEIDQIQSLAVQRGFGGTVTTRIRSDDSTFSTEPQYSIYLSKCGLNNLSDVKNRTQVETVRGELFWCVETGNGNFLMRRNGKVHLTGNSHGGLKDTGGKIMDVGVDTTGGNFMPYSIEDIKERMDARPAFEETVLENE